MLKTIKFLSGMREIVDTFFKTLPMVIQGLLVLTYMVFIFSILGMEAFSDAMSFRCASVSIDPATNITTYKPMFPQRFCDPNLPSLPYDYDGDGPGACVLPGGMEGNASIVSCAALAPPNDIGFHSFSSALHTVYKVAAKAGPGQALRATMDTKHPPQHVFLCLYYAHRDLHGRGSLHFNRARHLWQSS